jgi:hypothetical protein
MKRFIRVGISRLRLTVAVLPLIATAQVAMAKPVQLAIQPTAYQIVGMDRGSEIVVSRVGASEIWMQVPAPDDKNRVAVSFVFINKSDRPVNVGPEIISSDMISVVPYEKLMDEQKSRESTRKFGHFLANFGRAVVANEAGTSTGTVNYSGMTSNGTIYSGTGTVTVTDPVARERALEQAAAANETQGERMEQAFQYSRSAIAANLRTTTLMPNCRIEGVLTFEIPRALRTSSSSQQFTMTIQMGADRHILTGSAGPVGTVPVLSPSPELVALLAQRTALPASAPKPIPAAYAVSDSRIQPVSNQPLGMHGGTAQLATAEAPAKPKPKPTQKLTRAKPDDWGLVAVPSQVGY